MPDMSRVIIGRCATVVGWTDVLTSYVKSGLVYGYVVISAGKHDTRKNS
jgi:hypothetical protein